MSKIKIMVVDDEIEIIMLVASKLRVCGYEVITASDAVRATHIAVTEQPDLCILDIGMPGGSGYMVAERLTKNSRTMGTPIVFLTGRTSREDEKQAMDAGAFAYLIKPFKFEELLDVIAAALASVGKEAPARSAGPVV